MENEQRYGVVLANAAMLGCAFDTSGQLSVNGNWQSQDDGCPGAIDAWAREASDIGAKVVIVELGYRDQFDWRGRLGTRAQGGTEHLGQPAFDGYIASQIDHAITVLGANGARKVLFLSVPWSHPPDEADGSTPVAAAPARHAAINNLIAKAVAGHANASVLDIDKVISPSGRYQSTVNGKVCRFDGIHFTLYCSELLQPDVLGEVRSLIGS